MKCRYTANRYGVTAIFTLIAITTSVQPVHTAKILGVFLSPSPSHLIVHMSIMRTLAEQGHDITVVVGQKPKVSHEKIKTIIIEPSPEQQQQLEQELSGFGVKKQNPLVMMSNFLLADNVLFNMQFEALKNKRLDEIYKSKYDLAIMGYFVNDFQLIVPAKLNCPVIYSWTGQPMEMINNLVGVPHEASYVPSVFTSNKNGEVMTLSLRVFNVISSGLLRLLTTVMDISLEAKYKVLAAGDSTLRTYSEMKKNITLIFCNSHFSEGPIRPLVPGIVEIGGIQIKDKPDPLPKNLADFLNSSKEHGAILFSLGSNMKSSNVKPSTVQIIYKVLSSLKQNVIWKWEDPKTNPGNAKNILYQKWLPQDDILAHPNLRLFITHAGKGGMVEATYHGVPMVAMPIFAEQPANAAKIVDSGYGLEVDIINLEESAFSDAILEVLGNSSYRENIRKFAQLYSDRPLSARQTVIYWVEYVLRHHGASHIQSTLVHINWVQSNNFDVYVIIILALYVLWKLLKLVWKRFCKIIRFGLRKMGLTQSSKQKDD